MAKGLGPGPTSINQGLTASSSSKVTYLNLFDDSLHCVQPKIFPLLFGTAQSVKFGFHVLTCIDEYLKISCLGKY